MYRLIFLRPAAIGMLVISTPRIGAGWYEARARAGGVGDYFLSAVSEDNSHVGDMAVVKE